MGVTLCKLERCIGALRPIPQGQTDCEVQNIAEIPDNISIRFHGNFRSTIEVMCRKLAYEAFEAGWIDIETESHHLSRSLLMSSGEKVKPDDFRLPLCQLPAGECGRVYELVGEGTFKQRIRELGFGESSLVTKISGRSPVICCVNGTRIALNHGAASQILVERCVNRA
ncbi:MAG: ferrous iron transport protein A [Opitutaceae bacterium]|nr:ferrous iron transport protein A [Opitutaceae bacterium]